MRKPEAGSPQLMERLEWQVLAELNSGIDRVDRKALGLTFRDVAGTGLMMLGRYPQVTDFNRTLGLGLDVPASESVLDQLRAEARSYGLEHIMVGLVPGAEPDDLRDRLLALGAKPVRAWMQLWRDAISFGPKSTDLDVRELQAGDEAIFLEVLMRGFSMPPDLAPLGEATIGRAGWKHYLVWSGDTAIAGGSLFLHDGWGWLGNAATLPEWRRHGAQAALVARRIHDAAAAGMQRVFTQVAEELPDNPNPSEHNMRRAGFRTAYRREHFLLPTQT